MKMKLLVILGLLLLVSPALVFAGSACAAGSTSGPTILQLNHKLDFDFDAPSSDVFYSIDLVAGGAYEFRVDENYDDAKTSPDFTVSIYNVANGASCTTPLTVNSAAGSAATGVRDTSGITPVVPFNIFRGSVIATASGSYKIKVHNNDSSSGHYLSVTVTQTSLISSAFSQGGGYSAFYSFVNNTNQPIVITATAFNGTGTVVGTPFTSTLAAHANLSTSTGNMGVPSGTGYVILTHDGPLDSIATVATEANFNFSPAYIQDVSFKPITNLR